MMLGWLQAWGQKSPTMIIREVHTEAHPLVKNYSTDDDKFNLVKIYRDNLHYPRSSESKGLQIADMAASIIHHAVCGFAKLDNLMNYGLLLKRVETGTQLVLACWATCGGLPSCQDGDFVADAPACGA
jgi:hypothetical protein